MHQRLADGMRQRAKCSVNHDVDLEIAAAIHSVGASVIDVLEGIRFELEMAREERRS